MGKGSRKLVLEAGDRVWLVEGDRSAALTVDEVEVGTSGRPSVPPYLPYPGGSTVSFHVQRGVRNLFRFIEVVKPQVLKLCHCSGLAGEVQAASEDTFIIYRKVENNWCRYIYGFSDLDRAAVSFLDWIGPEIHEIQRLIGDRGFGVEGLNETIACGAVEDIRRVVEFERCFARRLRDRFPSVVPVSPNIAVGNPHHGAEEEMLGPLYETLADVGGYASYHAYWPANESKSWISLDWEDYAGRWVVQDEVTSTGVHWIMTEGGPVGGSNLPYHLSGGAGWRHPSCLSGDCELLVDEVLAFDKLARESSVGREGRYHGICLFTVGGGEQWIFWDYSPYYIYRMQQALVS